MTRIIKDLFSTDWNNELQSGDVAIRKEDGESIEVVLLAGLQRLARAGGLIRQRVDIFTPAPTMVQAVFTSIFRTEDGEVEFVGTADCNIKNTQGKFANYPTAVAESRAEARSLRKALGIRMLSSEEIGLREGFGSLEASPTGKADPQLIVAIEKLCENRGIDVAAVLEEVLEDKERASSIFELTELTIIEAQRALAWLNEQGPKKKQVSVKDQRDARKAELQAKQGETV
jgi:hypothetical protein